MNNVSTAINNMNIKMRPDNRFEGRITVNGTRKSFYGATKVEVKQKAKEYLRKIENGYKEPKKILLNEYIQYWLTTYKFNKIEPSSYTRLYRVYKRQIYDTIGKKMIGNITTSDIQRLIDEHANPRNENIKPLAMSGLKKIVHLLHPCFAMAVKEGIISSNPCDDVMIPSESYIAKETKQQYSLTELEISEIKEIALQKYKNGEYKCRNGLVLLILLNLGLRSGEMLALQWDDIDIDKKIVSINKTIQCGIRDFEEKEETVMYSRVKKSTKTKSGRRILKLNDTVLFYLKELREYDKRNNIESLYVCCTNKGEISSHRNLQKSLDNIIKYTQVDKRVTLHTLRHTFGSTLIRNGVGIEVISKLMGHANITITYNKYIHSIQEEEAKAMSMITIC